MIGVYCHCNDKKILRFSNIDATPTLKIESDKLISEEAAMSKRHKVIIEMRETMVVFVQA